MHNPTARSHRPRGSAAANLNRQIRGPRFLRVAAELPRGTTLRPTSIPRHLRSLGLTVRTVSQMALVRALLGNRAAAVLAGIQFAQNELPDMRPVESHSGLEQRQFAFSQGSDPTANWLLHTAPSTYYGRRYTYDNGAWSDSVRPPWQFSPARDTFILGSAANSYWYYFEAPPVFQPEPTLPGWRYAFSVYVPSGQTGQSVLDALSSQTVIVGPQIPFMSPRTYNRPQSWEKPFDTLATTVPSAIALPVVPTPGAKPSVALNRRYRREAGKVGGNSAGIQAFLAVYRLLDSLAETYDIFAAIYDAHNPALTRYSTRGAGQWRGVPQNERFVKVIWVIQNIAELDPTLTVRAILLNEIQDQIIGRASAAAKARWRRGRRPSVGSNYNPMVGPAL